MSESFKFSVNDKGLFSVKEKKLSLRGILGKRARIQSKILEAQEKLRHWQTELDGLQRELEALNSPVVNDWIQHMEQLKLGAEKKAQELLRGFVGELAYQKIQKQGYVNFTAKDGLHYKINRKGHVFRGEKQLCIIRPSELPLPDFVVAALVNVRESPRKFPLRR
jgi:hypothetical protein